MRLQRVLVVQRANQGAGVKASALLRSNQPDVLQVVAKALASHACNSQHNQDAVIAAGALPLFIIYIIQVIAVANFQ